MQRIIIYILVKFSSWLRSLLSISDGTLKLLFIPGFEKTRWNAGKRKAYIQYLRARRSVPAYKDFLKQHPPATISFKGLVPDLGSLPVTDKISYINPYPIEKRCVDGTLQPGVMIDESSGSSGQPVNWVRSYAERKANKRMLTFGLKQLLGADTKFIINAFALGSWATGMNISMSFAANSILKSPGPDISKIVNTLHFFGNRYQYIIMGYPPFLKSLLDNAPIDWKTYNVVFIYGGEGMSEAMRDYMLSHGIQKVYGSLGASDLELNIASENDFTIALRKLLADNKTLAGQLVKHPGAMPMIFQYNPLDFFIETNEKGELLISLCRPYYCSPKLRYNIHDTGHVVRIPALKKILASCGIDIASLGGDKTDLPLLFHYGRSDMAVAYFGCKITPSDIQEVIFRIPALAESVSAFSIQATEDEAVNKKLIVCCELNDAHSPGQMDSAGLSRQFFSLLAAINQDFRESVKMVAADNAPALTFYAASTGCFVNKDVRIKLQYIQKTTG